MNASLGVHAVQPLGHADLSVLVDITVPGQLLAAPLQALDARNHILEHLPLVPVQHLILVLVKHHKAPRGHLLFPRRLPRGASPKIAIIL